MDLQQARILVVGSTGVLGVGLAARLAAAGARLALAGRRADALAAIAAETGTEHTFHLDLLDVDRCGIVMEEAAQALGGLDALVVASGVAAFGPARGEQDVVVEELFAVNTFAPIALPQPASACAAACAGSRCSASSSMSRAMPTIAGSCVNAAGRARATSVSTSARCHGVRRACSIRSAATAARTAAAARSAQPGPPSGPSGSRIVRSTIPCTGRTRVSTMQSASTRPSSLSEPAWSGGAPGSGLSNARPRA